MTDTLRDRLVALVREWPHEQRYLNAQEQRLDDHECRNCRRCAVEAALAAQPAPAVMGEDCNCAEEYVHRCTEMHCPNRRTAAVESREDVLDRRRDLLLAIDGYLMDHSAGNELQGLLLRSRDEFEADIVATNQAAQQPGESPT